MIFKNEAYVTAVEVCGELSISKQVFMRLLKKHGGVEAIKIGRKYYYKKTSIENLIVEVKY